MAIPATIERALLKEVAIGQEHRVALGVCFDTRGVLGHHIRPIQEVSDAAETFCLTLGTEVAATLVEPFKRAVFLREATEQLELRPRKGNIT